MKINFSLYLKKTHVKLWMLTLACLVSNFSRAQWSVLNSGTNKQLWDVAAVSNNESFAVGATINNAQDGILLKTSNSGLTWDSVGFTAHNNLYGISFPTSQVGFICGAGIVLKSTDQGNSWDTVWYNANSDYLSRIQFVNENVGYVLDEEYYKFLKTMDGGQTWTEHELSFDEVYQFDFSSADTGLVAGYDGSHNIWSTVNGGLSWTVVKEGGTYSNVYSCISHVTSQTWCAIRDFDGQHAVLTNNNGQSWEDYLMNEVEVSGIIPPFRILKFPSDVEGWAAGDKYIIHSQDGGNNWVVNDSSFSLINGMNFFSAQLGYAAGDNGLLMKYMDGAMQVPEPAVFSDYNIFPNPAFEYFTIQCSPETYSTIKIELFDVNGKRLKNFPSEDFKNGDHSIVISTAEFSKGIYFVKIISANGIQNKKLIVE